MQIDEYLDWTKQIEYMYKNLQKSLFLLKRIRPFITEQMAMVFYKTIIQSKVDYCSGVWGNTAKTRIAKLQKILNRALRIVMRVEWTFPSEALFQLIQTKFNNHIDTLSDRSNKQLLHIMYKIVNENMPPTICKLFSFKKYIYSLRKATLQLEVPKPTTNFKKRSKKISRCKNVEQSIK